MLVLIWRDYAARVKQGKTYSEVEFAIAKAGACDDLVYVGF